MLHASTSLLDHGSVVIPVAGRAGLGLALTIFSLELAWCVADPGQLGACFRPSGEWTLLAWLPMR